MRPNRSACPTRSPASTLSELCLLVPSRSTSPWRCWSPPAWPSTSKTTWGTCTMSSATSGEDPFCSDIPFIEHFLPDVLHAGSDTGEGNRVRFSHLEIESWGSCLLCKNKPFRTSPTCVWLLVQFPRQTRKLCCFYVAVLDIYSHFLLIILQVLGTYAEKRLSKWHKILCPGVSWASVYFMTLHGGCKKLSHDFMWLAQVPFELLHSPRARTAEGQTSLLL